MTEMEKASQVEKRNRHCLFQSRFLKTQSWSLSYWHEQKDCQSCEKKKFDLRDMKLRRFGDTQLRMDFDHGLGHDIQSLHIRFNGKNECDEWARLLQTKHDLHSVTDLVVDIELGRLQFKTKTFSEVVKLTDEEKTKFIQLELDGLFARFSKNDTGTFKAVNIILDKFLVSCEDCRQELKTGVPKVAIHIRAYMNLYSTLVHARLCQELAPYLSPSCIRTIEGVPHAELCSSLSILSKAVIASELKFFKRDMGLVDFDILTSALVSKGVAMMEAWFDVFEADSMRSIPLDQAVKVLEKTTELIKIPINESLEADIVEKILRNQCAVFGQRLLKTRMLLKPEDEHVLEEDGSGFGRNLKTEREGANVYMGTAAQLLRHASAASRTETKCGIFFAKLAKPMSIHDIDVVGFSCRQFSAYIIQLVVSGDLPSKLAAPLSNDFFLANSIAWNTGRAMKTLISEIEAWCESKHEYIAPGCRMLFDAFCYRTTVVEYVQQLMISHSGSNSFTQEAIAFIGPDMKTLKEWTKNKIGGEVVDRTEATFFISQFMAMLRNPSKPVEALAALSRIFGLKYHSQMYDLVRSILFLRVGVTQKDRKVLLGATTMFLEDTRLLLGREAEVQPRKYLDSGEYRILAEIFPMAGEVHAQGKNWRGGKQKWNPERPDSAETLGPATHEMAKIVALEIKKDLQDLKKHRFEDEQVIRESYRMSMAKQGIGNVPFAMHDMEMEMAGDADLDKQVLGTLTDKVNVGHKVILEADEDELNPFGKEEDEVVALKKTEDMPKVAVNPFDNDSDEEDVRSKRNTMRLLFSEAPPAPKPESGLGWINPLEDDLNTFVPTKAPPTPAKKYDDDGNTVYASVTESFLDELNAGSKKGPSNPSKLGAEDGTPSASSQVPTMIREVDDDEISVLSMSSAASSFSKPKKKVPKGGMIAAAAAKRKKSITEATTKAEAAAAAATTAAAIHTTHPTLIDEGEGGFSVVAKEPPSKPCDPPPVPPSGNGDGAVENDKESSAKISNGKVLQTVEDYADFADSEASSRLEEARIEAANLSLQKLREQKMKLEKNAFSHDQEASSNAGTAADAAEERKAAEIRAKEAQDRADKANLEAQRKIAKINAEKAATALAAENIAMISEKAAADKAVVDASSIKADSVMREKDAAAKMKAKEDVAAAAAMKPKEGATAAEMKAKEGAAAAPEIKSTEDAAAKKQAYLDEEEHNRRNGIYSCGWMMKEAEGTFNKDWRPRWFEIKDGILSYYGDTSGSDFKGMIRLASCTIERCGLFDLKISSISPRSGKITVNGKLVDDRKELMIRFGASEGKEHSEAGRISRSSVFGSGKDGMLDSSCLETDIEGWEESIMMAIVSITSMGPTFPTKSPSKGSAAWSTPKLE